MEQSLPIALDVPSGLLAIFGLRAIHRGWSIGLNVQRLDFWTGQQWVSLHTADLGAMS
jgi:hypothetical protein